MADDRAAGRRPDAVRRGTRARAADAGPPPGAAAPPGVLPSQAIRRFVREGRIHAAAPIAEVQIQPASLDLRLGRAAYRLQASFLSGRASTVRARLADLAMAEIDLGGPAILEKGCVYLAPLMEALRLPADVAAKANPKSTTGRLDLFTRLIVDHGTEFEWAPAGYAGPLYAEIVPRTFSVVVHPGLSLSQIRFIRGRAPLSDTRLRTLDRKAGLVFRGAAAPVPAEIRGGVALSARLRGDRPGDVVAYRGRKNTPLVDLRRLDHYDPDRFWDPIPARPDGRLILDPGDFYILASSERVRVPPQYAAEMVPFDPAVGEFRIHYAGFFDPGFGCGDGGRTGTRAVLEVRAHETPFVIEHGQVVGRLVYSRMTARPDRIYGATIGSSYQGQELALSKQFRRPRGRCEALPHRVE